MYYEEAGTRQQTDYGNQECKPNTQDNALNQTKNPRFRGFISISTEIKLRIAYVVFILLQRRFKSLLTRHFAMKIRCFWKGSKLSMSESAFRACPPTWPFLTTLPLEEEGKGKEGNC